MAGALGVLAVGTVAATTEVEDVDCGPLRGCWRQVRQRSLPKLKTSMVSSLGRAVGMSDNGHHLS
jgi:hypothetical protein